MMLTLTIDPTLFPSAAAAYEYQRNRRAISRFMQDLRRGGHVHSNRYVCVIEFQQHTEQAHFHLLIDASYVPKSAIDAAWDKHRPRTAGPRQPNRPGFGLTRFSMRSFSGGAVHAARYATKYLVKTPEYGWPAWVLALGGLTRVPRFQTSRGFWGTRAKSAPPSDRKRLCTQRTYAERLADCGTLGNVFSFGEHIDPTTGEVGEGRTWLFRVVNSDGVFERLGLNRELGRRRVRIAAKDGMQALRELNLATHRAQSEGGRA